jgi:hypothetical protein
MITAFIITRIVLYIRAQRAKNKAAASVAIA